MYQLIADHTTLLLADSRLRGSVRDYATLRAAFPSVDVSRDSEFQRLYRQFWAVNAARVTPSWCDAYFRILEREKTTSNVNLRSIVLELRPVGGGALQVSFGSKLIHMIQPNLPIYDSLVAAAYFFRPPVTGSAERRLDKLLQFYGFLQAEYRRAVSSRTLEPAIRAFRDTFSEASTFSAEKILDFFIWTAVGLLQSGAQQRGELRYRLGGGSS